MLRQRRLSQHMRPAEIGCVEPRMLRLDEVTKLPRHDDLQRLRGASNAATYTPHETPHDGCAGPQILRHVVFIAKQRPRGASKFRDVGPPRIRPRGAPNSATTDLHYGLGRVGLPNPATLHPNVWDLTTAAWGLECYDQAKGGRLYELIYCNGRVGPTDSTTDGENERAKLHTVAWGFRILRRFAYHTAPARGHVLQRPRRASNTATRA